MASYIDVTTRDGATINMNNFNPDIITSIETITSGQKYRVHISPSATSLAMLFYDNNRITEARIIIEEDSLVTDLSQMFKNCEYFHTCTGYVKSPVTNTQGMFSGTGSSGVSSVNYSVKLPGTITNMRAMFSNIYYLTGCPSCLTAETTKNVTDMYCLFQGC